MYPTPTRLQIVVDPPSDVSAGIVREFRYSQSKNGWYRGTSAPPPPPFSALIAPTNLHTQFTHLIYTPNLLT